MMQTARQSLARQQAELVRALVAQGPIPAGFDEDRLRVAARSLVNKRRQCVARAWPKLVEIMGGAYVETFTRYAAGQPMPGCASPLADGRAYLRWLDAELPINDAARMEALAFDLRFAVTPTRMQPRRGFALKSARMRNSGTRVIGIRLPWLGIRWWR